MGRSSTRKWVSPPYAAATHPVAQVCNLRYRTLRPCPVAGDKPPRYVAADYEPIIDAETGVPAIHPVSSPIR